MSPEQVAVDLEMSASTVRRWFRTGVIKGERLGPRVIRIPVSEVDRLLNRKEM